MFSDSFSRQLSFLFHHLSGIFSSSFYNFIISFFIFLIYFSLPRTEAVFTITHMNNEWNIYFLQNRSFAIPVGFLLVEAPLKLFSLVWSFAVVFLLTFATSSNISLEMNFHFMKQGLVNKEGAGFAKTCILPKTASYKLSIISTDLSWQQSTCYNLII